MKLINLLSLAAICVAGCAAPNSIVTTAQSVLGFSINQNPASQLYEVRCGIVLSQIAFVPVSTNGTGFTPNLIQEFRVNNLFAGGLVYQRLAVGSNAVSQPGAAVMFAKDPGGSIAPGILQQLQSLHH